MIEANERSTLASMLVLAVCALVLSSGTACGGESPLDAKRVTLNIVNEDRDFVARQLSQQLKMPVCIEDYIIYSVEHAQSPLYDIKLDDVSGRTAMDQVVKVLGKYVWRETEEPHVINLIPADLVDDPEWFLNLKCPEFQLENASFREAANRINELLGFDGENKINEGWAFSIMTSGKLEDHWLYRFQYQRFTLTVKERTVRDALNQIAAGAENARWNCHELDLVGGRRWRGLAFVPIVPKIVEPETETGLH